MKPVIHTFIAILTLCSAIGADTTVWYLPLKSSLPFVTHLLDQPVRIHEGEQLALPYVFCGVFSEDQIAEYCLPADTNLKNASSSTTLPNGAIIHISTDPEQIRGDSDQIQFNFTISGPGSVTTEGDFSTYPGQGLLLRCQVGDEPAQIIVLQINEKDG